MSRFALLVLSLSAVIVTLFAQTLRAASAQNDRTEHEVATVAHSLSVAEGNNDLRALQRLWTDDYIEVSSLGRVEPRAAALERRRTAQVSFDAVEEKELKATIYGDVATTHELLHVKGHVPGYTLDTDERALRVFLRRDGRWRCVTAQYTIVGRAAIAEGRKSSALAAHDGARAPRVRRAVDRPQGQGARLEE